MVSLGSLALTLVEADLTRDMETVDSYVKITAGEQSFATSASEATDKKKPVWNETFTIDVKETATEITIEILGGGDEKVGVLQC